MRRLPIVRGFTLIELIAVIVILGVVGTTVVSFIGFSAQLFVDVNGRDKVLADSRFVVERLNRELRNAVPSSIRLAGGADIHCLEFMPIEWSSFYLDLPIAPDMPAANSFRAIELGTGGVFGAYVPDGTPDYVVVYPVSEADVYADNSPKRVLLQGTGPVVDGIVPINLQGAVQFPVDAESAASRFYIGDEPVSYCVLSSGQIRRFTNYGVRNQQSTQFGNDSGVLMAENLQNTLSSNPANFSTIDTTDDPFRVSQMELTRNAFVHILLRFAREDQPDEVVVFNNEVHVANAP
jgi:MSHA biogenesis protein MshO